MNSKIATMGLFAVLMVAAFAGIVVTGEDADAEGTTTGYSVAYIVEGKTYTVPQTSNTVKLDTLEDLGAKAPADKTFVAWNTAKNGSGTSYVAGSTLIIPEDGEGVGGEAKKATLYADFKWTTYTATFVNVLGETIGKPITGTMESSKQVNLAKVAPAAPAVEGMIFAGWLAEGADAPVAKADLGILSADVTYTAVYTVDYTITFVNGDSYYETCVSKLTVPDLGDRIGFKFIGWNDGIITIANANLKTYVDILTDDVTLTAVWEPAVYTVAFVVDGETVLTQSVKHGETATEPKIIPAKDGFDFVAWTVGDVAYDFSSAVTGDLTVTASFEAVPAPAPTGLKDPMTQMLLIIIGTLVLALIAVMLWKRDVIRAGLVKRLDKGDKGNGGDGTA